jgi:glutamine synthetase
MEREERVRSLLAQFREEGIRRIRLGGCDIDGIMRGKYISLAKFESAASKGFGFCDVIFGWDSADELYEGVDVKLTGWHTGYPDLHATIDLDSMRRVPWDNNTPFFLVDFHQPDGTLYPASPRQVLQKIIRRGEGLGYTARFAAEFEFYIYSETSHSVREKGYRALTPISPGMFGYSGLRSGTFSEMIAAIDEELGAFGIEVEGIHTETGPGVYEACVAHDTTLSAADQGFLFKAATKEILVRRGMMPTFMAKPSKELPGSSGHVHQSLWSDGKPVFHDAADPDGLSAVFRHYLAGLTELLPELMLMFCPTVNSYKRTVPGMWAPTTATWGIENRTTSLRVIRSESGKATRVENRLVGADMNAYLAFAASLGAGLYGIENKLTLGEPIEGNAYDKKADTARPLPRTLGEATTLFRHSKAARAIFGDVFVDHYAATREWEMRQFDAAVTDWEVSRYFEII